MLAGRIALVTGASRGIGRAVALALAREGATVAGTATSAEGAVSIDAVLAEGGHAGGGFVLDVSNAGSIEAALAAVRQRFGDPLLLVNNAGVTRDNLLMRMKEEEWDDVLDTDLKSVYRLSKAVLRPMMKERYGRIVNIGSVIGSMGNAGQTNYAAAKAGMAGFTRSLAREVGSRAITVNCVAPGFIETDMTRALAADARQALLGHVPLGRFGNAEEVAGCVLFLVSPAAAYVTGATLHVNGGMYME